MSDWLLTPITGRTTKRDLLSMVEAMPADYRGDGPAGCSQKADLAAWVRARREKYWDDQQAPSATPSKAGGVTRPRRRDDLCTITAAECNKWLQSLPVLPPYGEEGS